ncbi:MAG TPA: transcription termination/antitermination NusG family protein [Geobacterales bacterium]|nr:transcription termination/antitermination NusG family protein [Geobacterales bacterium]
METRSFAHAPNWMVLTTHAHREEFAIENLVRQDYEAYCPMIVKRIKHARRAYDAKRPLFPGYVFVERPAQRHLWRPLLGTFGVRSVVCNGETPSLLPAGFVESLRARETDGAIRKPEMPFKTGQSVTINGGAFDGFVGQILEIRESDRVLLLLNLLNQQTRVHIETKMLRSA